MTHISWLKHNQSYITTHNHDSYLWLIWYDSWLMTHIRDSYVISILYSWNNCVKLRITISQWVIAYKRAYEFSIWLAFLLRNGYAIMISFQNHFVIDDVKVKVTYVILWVSILSSIWVIYALRNDDALRTSWCENVIIIT